ncbi:hypothetical protein FF38_05539 [Lucilia cuprina]|uniref:Uncharacterized protein n=1 Tax=Lucilia cuprina TaxID=7375 RepID=A0A0L0BN64_LUCCU|nr:hypothetical protein FF38_05539 [Lucilia cuprina]
MFVAKKEAIVANIRLAAPQLVLDGNIPQCDTARIINEEVLKYDDFRTTPTSALISCLLLALPGIKHPDDKNNPAKIFAEPYYPQYETNRSLAGSGVSYKELRGISTPLFILDKDKATIKAIKFAFPDSDLRLCYWHTARSGGFEDYAFFLSRKNFEEHDDCYQPYLKNCRRRLLTEVQVRKLCYQHNSDFYMNHCGDLKKVVYVNGTDVVQLSFQQSSLYFQATEMLTII